MMNIQRIKSMPSTRLVSVILIVCYVSFSQNIHKICVAARPLNSIQLATGEWDVSIRGGFWMDASRIFPSVRRSEESTANTKLKQSPTEKTFSEIIPFVKRRRWRKSIDCTLSLASDGTFVLTPKYVETVDPNDNSSSNRKEEYETTNHDLIIKTNERNEETRNGLLDIRGSWNVLANPYCVTDRLYDQVSLQSYPRQKMATVKGQENSDNTEEKVLETFQLALNCRMWGRHNRQNAERRTQQRYRMTHGALVCKDHDVPWWKQFCRPVVGSFSAVRSSHKPKHEGWIDQDRYGYSTE